MLTMMLMLMMLMMMRKEQLPTFFWSETAMAIPTVNYKSVEDKPLAWDSPGLLIFRFIAPDRDWNDRSELILIAKAFGN